MYLRWTKITYTILTFIRLDGKIYLLTLHLQQFAMYKDSFLIEFLSRF